MMFSGFSITKAEKIVTTVSSSPSHSSNNHNKRIILPITSRHAIIRNSSSSYKSKRKYRAKQLQSLHNDILNDDNKWIEFHYILQQTIQHKGITNSTVKALLFDAFDSYQNSSSTGSAFDIRDRKEKETNIIISQTNDSFSQTLAKINTIISTKIENVEEHQLPSNPMQMQDNYQGKNHSSFIYNSIVSLSSQPSSVPTPAFVNNNNNNTTIRTNKLDSTTLHNMMTIVTKEEEESSSSWRRKLKNHPIKTTLLSVDSILEETMNNISQLDTATPNQRHYNNNNGPYKQLTVPAA